MKKIGITLLLVMLMFTIGCSSGQELFEDDNLAQLVSNKLGIETTNITEENVTEIKNLKVTGSEGEEVGTIKSLAGIENLTQLTALSVNDNQITDIKPLGELTELQYLDLSNNQIKDIEPLTNLDKLMHLDISDNDLDTSSESETMEIIEELEEDDVTVKY